MRLKVNNHMLNQLVDMCDLETIIELYKADIISDKYLLQKLGYRDVLEMYLSHQKELENTHNKCPYLCLDCKDNVTRYDNSSLCDVCSGAVCEYCFAGFIIRCDCNDFVCKNCVKKCIACQADLCTNCLYDHRCQFSCLLKID